MDNFSFNPVNGFEDTDAYPNPSSGTQTRSQLMSIPKQIRDFINNTLIPAVNGKQDTLTIDQAPTASSTNPVASGGVKTALDTKQNALTWDQAPTQNSDHAVSSGVVYDALHGTLTLSGLKLVVGGVTYNITVENGSVVATPQS